MSNNKALFAQGKRALGGPFLMPDLGGMMIPMLGVTQEALDAYAAADPLIQSGLLRHRRVFGKRLLKRRVDLPAPCR